MTVGELVLLLSRFPKDAVVVVGDPHDGGIGRLRADDVREVRLRFGESNGVSWYDLAEQDEPFDAHGIWIG